MNANASTTMTVCMYVCMYTLFLPFARLISPHTTFCPTGISCERTVCPGDCNGQGICYTQAQFAANAGAVYSTPWDASKEVGCLCDLGYRGPDCSLRKYYIHSKPRYRSLYHLY